MNQVSYFFFSLCILTAFINEAYATDKCYDGYLDYEMKVHDCSGYRFSTIPANISADVQILKLDNNYITHISNTAFVNYADLISLDLSSNDITDIQENSFKYLSKLQFLILDDNQFEKFDQHCPNLHSLSIRNGLLNYFDIHDSVVTNLTLENTKLENFPNIKSPYLEELNIMDTKIHNLSVEDIAPFCNLMKFRFNSGFPDDCNCISFNNWLNDYVHIFSIFECSETLHCTTEETKYSERAIVLRRECENDNVSTTGATSTTDASITTSTTNPTDTTSPSGTTNPTDTTTTDSITSTTAATPTTSTKSPISSTGKHEATTNEPNGTSGMFAMSLLALIIPLFLLI